MPLYRDEATLAKLFERVGPVLASIEGGAELVLVDDGSPDRTGEIAVELGARATCSTTVVRLARNFGQHPAVFAGLAHSRGRVVVTMDSDLQYPPEDIPRLLEALSPEFPVVSGVRVGRRDPLGRRLITRFLGYWLGRRTGRRLQDYGSMFRAYDRRVVDLLLQFTEQRRFVPALVAWLGVPVREVPVQHETRSEAGSRYRLGPLVDMFLDLITGYSIFPLRLVTLAGFAGSVLGFLAALTLLVYRVVIGAGVSGLISAFALVCFLLGVQLLVVALLGEYVGRIYTEARSRPYYLVRDVTRNG